jgi:hypothetical protein
MNVRVLFIIKRQLGYNGSAVPSKGLFNSALFVVNALRRIGIVAELVEVVDANDIDREVARCCPTHCIIEALWVTPLKLAELRRLHHPVQFVVRIHSNIPFLASEGMALDWLTSYGSLVGCNSSRAVAALQPLTNRQPVYLPNIYEPGVPSHQKTLDRSGRNLWIGCLGAIRPLKNQLQQAMAAMAYADLTQRRLVYHINTRMEQGGEPVLRNIRALFAHPPHMLVQHDWVATHKEVREIVAAFDLSLQVSFTETFNLVSADAVWAGVPIVVSPEIEWAPGHTKVRSNTIPEIIDVMQTQEREGKHSADRNLTALLHHNQVALETWTEFLSRKVKQ